MLRFSIRELMLMTTSVAAGFVVSGTVNEDLLLDSRLTAFLLGMVSLLLSVGLAQQIIWPPPTVNSTIGQQTFRRFFLAMLLCGIGFGIYRTCVPYPASLSAISQYQSNQNEPIYSTLALPLWYFSLMLAAMTAPWNSEMGRPTKMRNGCWQKVVNAAVVTGVFAYCLALANETAFIHSLVDIAIQGVSNQISQGPAVGTSHYVELFNRTPGQFQDFVQWQVITYPPALLACFGLIGWGSTLRSRWWWLVLAISITPACVNLGWLFSGQAGVVFPIQASTFQASTFAESSSPDVMLWGLGFLLAVVLLATRSVAPPSNAAPCDQTKSQKCSSDHGLIGWALMAIGALAIASLCQEYAEYGLLRYTIVLETVFDPDHMLGPLMLFIGMQWQWRRFRFQDVGQERWPNVSKRQYCLIPLVAITLLVTALTSIPFGVAILHFGL